MTKKAKTPKREVPPTYFTTEWSGRPHYHCTKCLFDSLNKTAMLDHLVAAHDSEAALEELVALQSALEEKE